MIPQRGDLNAAWFAPRPILALNIMSNEIKEAAEGRKGLVSWKAFPDMPKWQREMERMFGDFSEEKVATSEIKEIDIKIK
jgi:hypothetical protein